VDVKKSRRKILKISITFQFKKQQVACREDNTRTSKKLNEDSVQGY